MLVIRAEQLAAMETYAQNNFKNRVSDYLMTLYQEQAALIDTHAIAGAAFAFGRINGISSERDIASLAGAMLLLGPQFADDSRFPWAAAILLDELGSKGERLHECARIESGLDSQPAQAEV